MVLAAMTRLPALTIRPMHADEAVHAAILGQFLRTGSYRYDPNDYHGPTLNYITAIAAMIRGQKTFQSLDELTLRLVPAIAGMIMVLLPLAMADGLGRKATIMAMLFTAVSPCMVYYSRYFMHEPLLVLFSLGLIVCIWRYIRRPSLTWAILIGGWCGLVYATKETSIIVFASVIIGCLVARPWRGNATEGLRRGQVLRHILVGLTSCIVIAATLCSSFWNNPGGIIDSLTSFGCYLSRAGNGRHSHPWYYYLDLLTWIPFLEPPAWNEGFLVVCFAAGLALLGLRTPVGTDRHLARFLATYTLVMLVTYCLIPYKTPWCMMGFLQSMILVSAILYSEVNHLLTNRSGRIAWIVATTGLGIMLPMWQCEVLNLRLHSDPRNPYVYAHTTQDVPALAHAVDRLVQASSLGRQVYIQVIYPGHDYWPLPWYLRSYPKVGYWSRVDKECTPGDIIIISPDLEPDLIRLIYDLRPPGQAHLYVPLMDRPVRLRHGALISAYVRKDLYDAASADAAAGL
ncbi:MAG: TIGR03663 family protein [Sedimentisphaerales bacterium]|nr:TIGR03663 family protein [Sedimentisphaerales bacterium]